MTVTICGSMRYISVMLREYERLSLEGYLVYLPVILGISMKEDSISIPHHSKLSDDLKERLQQLHFKKILLSDFIFVVNPGGYIGEGTLAEIEYAKRYNVPIKYLEGDEEK